jgi:cbb3-type cytochrome oxidase maturation protein
MSVVIVLILASLTVGLIFLGAFIWSVRNGQYEDTLTPSLRVLLDDTTPQKQPRTSQPGTEKPFGIEK